MKRNRYDDDETDKNFQRKKRKIENQNCSRKLKSLLKNINIDILNNISINRRKSQ